MKHPLKTLSPLLLRKPSVLALFLTLLYFVLNGYTYGWDDQHLEIPLLKHLIIPDLYSGDYYVESLKENFPSWFYPVLAKLLTIEMIKPVYAILFVISRYFLFYWSQRLWALISGRQRDAFYCVASFIIILRVEEFLYRTFSHQEFALAFVMAGLYYFFRSRLILSAAILGFATNIHAIYSLFPMFFIFVDILKNHRAYKFKDVGISGLLYFAISSPFWFWILHQRITGGGGGVYGDPEWLDLYITSCPQNFFFPDFPTADLTRLIQNPKILYYGLHLTLTLLGLGLLNVIFNPLFKRFHQAGSIVYGSFFLYGLSFIFNYLRPHPFFLDLNLIRSSQFLLFVLGGFTTLLVVKWIRDMSLFKGVCAAVSFALLKFNPPLGHIAILLLLSMFTLEHLSRKSARQRKLIVTATAMLIWVITGIILAWAAHIFFTLRFKPAFLLILGGIVIGTLTWAVLLAMTRLIPRRSWRKEGLLVIPLIIFALHYGYFHYQNYKIRTEGDGFWALQRSWEDMQNYVREHTPVTASLLVPYNMEMGGFRIGSERSIIASYRDCGIIGFDFQAVKEWRRRIASIEPFQIQITKPIGPVLQRAVEEYKVDYIVFMRYAQPQTPPPNMKLIYYNTYFSLFEMIDHNPPSP